MITGQQNPEFDLNDRQKRIAGVVWYSQPMGRYLTNDVLIAGVRDRLELPLFAQNATCQYTTRTSQRLCATPLDVQGENCNRCCHALIQARHHALRDWVKTQLNEAGEHASTEQSILVRAGPNLQDNASPDLWHRADVVSIDTAGSRTL